jgi:hypothetical protein
MNALIPGDVDKAAASLIGTTDDGTIREITIR